MKVADVKLKWTRSPSADVVKVRSILTVNGATTTTEFGPEVESMMVTVEANSSVSFKVEVTDSEGLVAVSESYAFSLGDLQAPLPATSLGHEVAGVRDALPPPPATLPVRPGARPIPE